MRDFFIFTICLLQFNFVYAHVGSPDVALESMVGPYHALISIKPSGAIPGTATLSLFVDNGSGINVYARPIYFSYGKNASPPSDRLDAVPGHPGQFEGIVWLMDNGSASIELSIAGPLGKGEILVPIVAISTVQQKLPATTAYILIALGAFLLILLITIGGLSVSEAITERGKPIPANRKRARRIAFGFTAVFCMLAIYTGNAWWQSKVKVYSKYLFKPMHANYHLEQKTGFDELRLTIDTANSQRKKLLPYIIPDHGKIMHLFIIRFPDMDVFAHLHPERTDLLNFTTKLPTLPGGKYLAYADIVYNSGFTETMKDTFVMNNSYANVNPKFDSVLSDPDDALALSGPFKWGATAQNKNKPAGNDPKRMQTKDGTTIKMDERENDANYQSGQLYLLLFSLCDKTGQPVKPDLYMGMRGHAIIIRSDGNVFAHIHPVGTYSMAAQTSLLDRMNLPENQYSYPDETLFRDSVDRLLNNLKNMSEDERNAYLMNEMKMPTASTNQANENMPGMAPGHSMTGMDDGNNTVSFPYTFPSPGKYRIWVQVKVNGQIVTAAFDRNVK